MAGKIRRLIIIINDDWLDVGSIELFFTDFLLSIKEIRGEELAGKIRRLIIMINDHWIDFGSIELFLWIFYFDKGNTRGRIGGKNPPIDNNNKR